MFFCQYLLHFQFVDFTFVEEKVWKIHLNVKLLVGCQL
jgi:hypothetical protein